MAYVFTPRDILARIRRILVSLGYDVASDETNSMCEYILARTIERIYLVSMYPPKDFEKDKVYHQVSSSYLDEASGYFYKLDQDVGSNTLFPLLRSTGLALESSVKVKGFQTYIQPREMVH